MCTEYFHRKKKNKHKAPQVQNKQVKERVIRDAKHIIKKGT